VENSRRPKKEGRRACRASEHATKSKIPNPKSGSPPKNLANQAEPDISGEILGNLQKCQGCQESLFPDISELS
ncbi:MAG: hypothetical protein ACM3U2_14420, partial [Deltaproteobacteria bacterium]